MLDDFALLLVDDQPLFREGLSGMDDPGLPARARDARRRAGGRGGADAAPTAGASGAGPRLRQQGNCPRDRKKASGGRVCVRRRLQSPASRRLGSRAQCSICRPAAHARRC